MRKAPSFEGKILELPTITIYDCPDDMPAAFVARLFYRAIPTEVCSAAPNLDAVRDWAKDHLARLGVDATCIARDRLDHPSVVETWL